MSDWHIEEVRARVMYEYNLVCLHYHCPTSQISDKILAWNKLLRNLILARKVYKYNFYRKNHDAGMEKAYETLHQILSGADPKVIFSNLTKLKAIGDAITTIHGPNCSIYIIKRILSKAGFLIPRFTAHQTM